MRSPRVIYLLLVLFCAFALFAGCSSRFDPLAPEGAGSDPIASGQRADARFEELLKASDHDNYTQISGTVDAATGGSIQGTVAGYDTPFRLQVPPGACSSLCMLSILVPNEGVPVYQLLPHMNFQSDLTVTLDYSKWIDEGVLGAGGSYEIKYMNEASGQFEHLTPRACFTADPENPTVSFSTDHFSRWTIDDGD